MQDNVISLRNVSKSFSGASTEEFKLFKNLSVDVKTSEILAIMGASGSGKSTLLQLMGLLDKPDSGQITILGKDTGKMKEADLTKLRGEKIGFIYQHHHLLQEFSVFENLILPQLAQNKCKKKANIRVLEVLKHFNLEDKLHSFPSELSGGQRQRIAVARALINKPAILLADEPTGSLDKGNTVMVMKLLIKEVQERKLSAVIVTHNQSIASMADRVLKLDFGLLTV